MTVDDVAQGLAVLAKAVSAYRRALGERLVAAYALGSLAHGGFSPLVSDVDLAIVLADPLTTSDAGTVQEVADAVKAAGSTLHRRLSVFWGTRSTLGDEQAGGRFPPLDLLDLVENGVLLAGEDVRAGLPQPSRADLLVAGAEFALAFLAGVAPAAVVTGQAVVGSLRPAEDDAVEELRRPELLMAGGVRHVTKVVLFPVRFLYTAETGRVGTNESAVEHYLGADPPAPATELVAAAFTWRSAPPDDAQAIALLHHELIPLYLHYIDDHVARLTDLGRADLAEAFLEWRRRILA